MSPRLLPLPTFSLFLVLSLPCLLLAACGDDGGKTTPADTMDVVETDTVTGCNEGSECPSGVCDVATHTCLTPTCADDVVNGNETGVDCGGPDCDRCPTGQTCSVPADCVSLVCDATSVCADASCTDNIANGDETDIDCGGSCGPCPNGFACGVAMDCASGVCDETLMSCISAECRDMVLNGDETAVDCGGSCGPCATGQACMVPADCVEGVCDTRNICAAPACNDMVMNGDESDTDCGGSCPRCAEGGACTMASDCVTNSCVADACRFPTSCVALLEGDPTLVDGVYLVDIDGNGGLPPINVQCDMTTSGGGWMLVLEYLHQGGTNPALSIRTANLPLQSTGTLGEDGSLVPNSWGHAGNALLSAVDFDQTMWLGRSGGHDRVIHFMTSGPEVISYLKTGTGCASSAPGTGVFDRTTTTELNQRLDATLPLHTSGEDSAFCDQGDLAMTEFPFYSDSGIGNVRAHWGIRGAGDRWEVDDGLVVSTIDTHHQVWVRPNPCGDGRTNLGESDVDCGGACAPCAETSTCNSGADCTTGVCDAGSCGAPLADCASILATDMTLPSRIYNIDPAPGGAPFDAYCDMATDGGGWTLIMVTAADGVATWTWNARALMTSDNTTIGALGNPFADYKSPAYHRLPFSDLLFEHNPSGVSAAYGGVNAGMSDFGAFMGAQPPPPVCNNALAGNGFEQTGGSLTNTGSLCDTDLYFSVGDHELGIATCNSLTTGTSNNATFGPVWSAGYNNGCPFDDPATNALGPSNPCVNCAAGTADTENAGLGFGRPAGLNTGSLGNGMFNMRVFVR